MLSLCTCVLSLSYYSRTFSIIPHSPPLLQDLHIEAILESLSSGKDTS